jgi:hypothetical protein
MISTLKYVLIIASLFSAVSEALVYRINDVTMTPNVCRRPRTFPTYMKCMLENNLPCSRVTTFSGRENVTAKVRFVLPFEYEYGKRCILTPRLGEMLNNRTRVKTATLNYSIILNQAYDNVGFIKLPGLAGIRNDRADLFDWVRP